MLRKINITIKIFTIPFPACFLPKLVHGPASFIQFTVLSDVESSAVSHGLPTKQFSKFLYLPRPFVIPRASSKPWFGFHRNTNQHQLAAKLSASKVYPLSLVWYRAHECTHFTNGNNSNFVGKQPSKLCVNFSFITQLFLCVKFDVPWPWRHSLFHKYRLSFHWNVTGYWIKM